MSPRPEFLRLCHLLHQSLQPFSDLASNSLTEETEKDLLVALSQIFRQVKHLTNGFHSDEELLAEPIDDTEYSVDATAHLDNQHCLAKITVDLMFMLAVKSKYAQHLAGNTLVAVSEFLLASDSDWDYFMQLLCLCLELAIRNSLRSSLESSASETRYLDYGPSTSTSLLKLKLESANWSMVAAIFRVLRSIQKYPKQEFDDKLMKAYLDSVSSLILNFPLDLLREVYVGQTIQDLKGSAKDIFLQTEVDQLRELTVLFGNFIQFLCSLVTQSSSLEDRVGFSPVICRIINLVPKLAAWCHADLQSPYHVRVTHYFRHKVLMLMVKLSSEIHIDQTVNMTWICLIHKYFEDLLLHPISGGKFDQDDFLEGSPFCTSIFDPGKEDMSSRHLQRLTVFLFLKCLLNLISVKGSPDEPQRPYENLKLHCSTDINLDSELHEWLQSHIPADILLNNELYFERCVRFASSFLQLFMHEDDILFEMLLQLFHVPFCLGHEIIKGKPLAEAEVKNRLVFLASDLFNPIHLFHLFLAQIHYDHQVVLDYLISKDTGSSCAEYLLRSLRIICNSWSLFAEFPGVEEDLGQSCAKRQKNLADCTDKGGHAHDKKSCRNYRLPYAAARDCLLSLKTSIGSLNEKNLFPYNPQVLLQRLTRFEELCIES